MTKTIITILLVCWTSLLAQKNPEIKQVEFSKVSRGYEEHVRINPDSVHVFVHDIRGDKAAVKFARKVDDAEWVELVKTTKGLKFKDIDGLPSPTMKRASDAAMHGTLTITTGEDKSFAHGFDDENPHDSLKPLLKAVKEISGRKEAK
jgi:hypothetical protein